VVGTFLSALLLLAIGVLAGCSTQAAKSPDVSDNVRHSLDQAGYKDVTVSESRDKGVVTLSGSVNSEARRSHAQAVASTVPNVQQVVDEIQIKDQKATTTN
jgi:osmotically-inducible protein OsmY